MHLTINCGLRDAQQARPVCHCRECGGEIYASDPVYLLPCGGLMHEDCLDEYVSGLEVWEKAALLGAVRGEAS